MLGMQTQWFLSVLDRMHRSRDKGGTFILFTQMLCKINDVPSPEYSYTRNKPC